MHRSTNEVFTVLVANPGADVYGSDLQLLESISAMSALGWRVIVAVPDLGPLVCMLRSRGAEIMTAPFPVVRREHLSAGGVLRLTGSSLRALTRLRTLLSQVDPDVIYVNTVTIPIWLLAARVSRIPVVCHVHEAEASDSRFVTTALYSPLLLSTSLIVNSRAAATAMHRAVRWLRSRTVLVYNGVPGPPSKPSAPDALARPFRLAIVCRLTPRKAPDVALEAMAQLRAEGRDVHLEVCGSVFDGYEWYEEQLLERASRPDLVGSVTFSGYQRPVWAALERCDAVLAPSLREPFGNAVIEAQLALRPVVASAALGHLETIADGETGLLVTPGDARALAAGVARLMDTPGLAPRLARQARRSARDSFSISRYNSDITELVRAVAGRERPRVRRASRRPGSWPYHRGIRAFSTSRGEL